MKNLMKLSLCLLSFTFLLVSCGESSIKGKWTSSDMEKCKVEGIKEIEKDTETEEMMALMGTSNDEFVSCACEKFEEKYDSYSIASIEADKMSEEEAGIMMFSCIDTEKSWKGIGSLFLGGCIGEDPAREGYCTCVLENIMTDFEPLEMLSWGDEDYEVITERYSDCLALIPE